MLRHALRDTFRLVRNVIDRLRHGARVELDGEIFDLPAWIPASIRRAMRDGSYEAPERRFVADHLPSDLPVVELGGSIGVVGRFVGRKIGPGRRHLVVEANPALTRTCATIAKGEVDRPLEVIAAAVAYSDVGKIWFKTSSGLLDSRVVAAGTPGAIAVPTVRLRDLRRRLGEAADYSLVCDIEGAEYELFSQPVEEFDGCRAAILEMHPAAYEARGGSLQTFLDLVAAKGFVLVERSDNVAAFARREA
ncbi:MAG: FkbM family methyltransferase [Phyllobacteriaceae bacterium]|nr:FkbM family methyltransferase [Phyllobacteriaceae bacterium]